MMANDVGLDFERIRHAITLDYPRAADMPGPGFAAGPCLFKDTMQLAAFNNNNFVLGHSAMLINEGLPLYLVSKLEAQYDLAELTVGMLGMAFKGGSDDPRESLAYKLRKILMLKAKETLCADPYVVDDRLLPQAEVLERSDLLVIARTAPGVPQSGHEQADRRHLGHHGRRGAGLMHAGGRRSRSSSRSTTRAAPSCRAWSGSCARSSCPCEVLVVHDTPDDTTVPYASKVAETDPRVRTVLNTYGRGPANAIRFGIERALRRSPWSRWPTGPTTRARSTTGPAGRPRRRGRRGVAVHARRPAGRRAVPQAVAVPAGRALAAHLRPGRHPGRDQQLQGVLDRRSSARSASTAAPGSRSGSS